MAERHVPARNRAPVKSRNQPSSDTVPPDSPFRHVFVEQSAAEMGAIGIWQPWRLTEPEGLKMKRVSLMSLVLAGTLQYVATPSYAADQNVFQSASLAVVQACADRTGQAVKSDAAATANNAPKFVRVSRLLRHFCRNRNASASARLFGSDSGFSFGSPRAWAGGRDAYSLNATGNDTVSRGTGGIQTIPLTGSKFKIELKPTAATLKLSW